MVQLLFHIMGVVMGQCRSGKFSGFVKTSKLYWNVLNQKRSLHNYAEWSCESEYFKSLGKS